MRFDQGISHRPARRPDGGCACSLSAVVAAAIVRTAVFALVLTVVVVAAVIVALAFAVAEIDAVDPVETQEAEQRMAVAFEIDGTLGLLEGGLAVDGFR